jgi:hypothetical protein
MRKINGWYKDRQAFRRLRGFTAAMAGFPLTILRTSLVNLCGFPCTFASLCKIAKALRGIRRPDLIL